VSVPCFLLFLCFRKVTQEIFSELNETKARRPDIYRSFQRTKKETERSRRAATTPGGAAWPWPAPTCGVGPLIHFWCCPFAYKDPPDGKNLKTRSLFQKHIAIRRSSSWDREGPEALSGTLSERGITTEGLINRHACLRHDEWVVYLGLWIHSSS
jgi:hypothetical protein